MAVVTPVTTAHDACDGVPQKEQYSWLIAPFVVPSRLADRLTKIHALPVEGCRAPPLPSVRPTRPPPTVRDELGDRSAGL